MTEDKILKLFALAKHGVGGELKNAKAALDRLLKREGLTIEDVERMLGIDEHPEQKKFTFKNTYERQLLSYVADHVIKDWNRAYYHQKGSRSTVFYLMTESQYVQASFLYEILKGELGKSLTEFTQIFAHKNALKPNREVKLPDIDDSEISFEDQRRITNLYAAAKRVNIRKQLGE